MAQSTTKITFLNPLLHFIEDSITITERNGRHPVLVRATDSKNIQLNSVHEKFFCDRVSSSFFCSRSHSCHLK